MSGQNPAPRTLCPPDIPQTEGRKWASTTSEWANPLYTNIHRILSHPKVLSALSRDDGTHFGFTTTLPTISNYEYSGRRPPPISDHSVWDLWWTNCL